MQNLDYWGYPILPEDQRIFYLLAKAYGPKPQRRKVQILTKTIPAKIAGALMPKKDPRLVVPMKKAEPSDRELHGALSHACALCLISGHDALAAEKLLHDGKPLPAEIRHILLGGKR